MAEFNRSHYWKTITRAGLIVVTGVNAINGGCISRGQGQKESNNSERPTQTFTPEPTLTSTLTVTPFPTDTPTETPIPNEVLNNQKIEQSLEGEEITLENISLDRVFVTNARVKELIGAALKVGEATVIIENFDCQFDALREQGLLGGVSEHDSPLFPTRSWNIQNVVFSEIRVTKNANVTDEITLLTSESFVLGEASQTCPEKPILQPAEELARQAWRYIAELAEEALETDR